MEPTILSVYASIRISSTIEIQRNALMPNVKVVMVLGVLGHVRVALNLEIMLQLYKLIRKEKQKEKQLMIW